MRIKWRERGRLQCIQAGPAAGLWLDPGTTDPGYLTGTNELPVQQAFCDHVLKGHVVYDVGANIGFFALLAARLVGPAGKVFAFEPVPTNAQLVRDNAAANGFAHLKVVEAAVADEGKRMQLALAEHAGGAMLSRVGQPPDAKGCITVDVVTLDDMVFATGLPAPDFIKLDVEGAEALALSGMSRVLSQSQPRLLVEVDASTPAELERRERDLKQQVKRQGYDVQDLPLSYAHSGWCVSHFVATP